MNGKENSNRLRISDAQLMLSTQNDVRSAEKE